MLWWKWITIPVIIIFCSILERFLQKEVMHQRVNNRGLIAFYKHHTLNHHRLFTDQEMRFRYHKDGHVTVFPPYAVVIFILMSIPLGLFAGWFVSSNVGWLIMSSTTGMYFLYEFIHLCCHSNENAFVRYCLSINTLRRHHTTHHNSRLMMNVNMNLIFPIACWLFGSSDLDRSLLGHLFNGHSTKYLRWI